jgi:hypothetical protein
MSDGFVTTIRRKASEVAPEVAKLLRVLRGEMSRAEIMSELGLKDEKHFRERYQQAAIASGLVEMTRPDAPHSRLQSYRLTDKGRAVLAAMTPEGPARTRQTRQGTRRSARNPDAARGRVVPEAPDPVPSKTPARRRLGHTSSAPTSQRFTRRQPVAIYGIMFDLPRSSPAWGGDATAQGRAR